MVIIFNMAWGETCLLTSQHNVYRAALKKQFDIFEDRLNWLVIIENGQEIDKYYLWIFFFLCSAFIFYFFMHKHFSFSLNSGPGFTSLTHTAVSHGVSERHTVVLTAMLGKCWSVAVFCKVKGPDTSCF